jgi:DNA-binding GntR family transcriptional regulator
LILHALRTISLRARCRSATRFKRLTGEGLVENSQNEGFRVAQMNEAAVRDIYDWCRDLVHICLARADHQSGNFGDPQWDGQYAEEVTRLLLRIAACSVNHEHRRAMANLCERSFLLRLLEEDVIERPFEDLASLRDALDDHSWSLASDAFDRLHQKRVEVLPSIIARLRDRTVNDRNIIF